MGVLEKLQQRTLEISDMAKHRAEQQEINLERRNRELEKEER